MSTYYVAGIPYSDELYHFGIKGQKWGIRRFENEDGTLTAEGKARYRVNSVGEYQKKALNSGKNISNETGNVIRNASDIIRRGRKNDSNENVKNMSDEELRRRLNRIQMERQYSQLTSSYEERGRDKVLQILETTGSVVAIAGGLLGIAATIKDLTGFSVKAKK